MLQRRRIVPGSYNSGMVQPLDICIRGAGVVGRTLALLLARERLKVGLVAQPAAATDRRDVRAYALNQASRHLLESVRAWPDANEATPVLAMQVKGDAGGEVRFSAAEQGSEALTWIVDVPPLEDRLAEAVRYQPAIEVLDAAVPATLTVVCEGRASVTRAEFGVDFEALPYRQYGIATRLLCEKPHGQVARQWFSDGEILAFLPLSGAQGNSVAVVWSVPDERWTAHFGLSDEAFCARLEALSEMTLGRLTLAGERASWPLQWACAQRWTGPGWVLAGDAAHNVHPLTGQGLNLGLGDVAELACLIGQRDYWRSVADPKLLRRYERTRRAGLAWMGGGSDSLQRLFAHEGSAARNLRNQGMNWFERSGPVKQWVARQAMGLR